MKKLLWMIALMLPLLTTEFASAQNARGFYKTPYRSRNSGSFGKHVGILSLGFGFPNQSGTDIDYWDGDDHRFGFGPMYVKYEHGILPEVGLGGYLAFAGSKFEYGPNRRYTDRIFSFGGGFLGYYHFNKLIPVRNLDVYAGAGIGFRNISYSYDDDFGSDESGRSDFDVFPVVKVGARYYFTSVFGVYGEAGYDKMSDVNFGVSFRFR
jgi:hypothetical protein